MSEIIVLTREQLQEIIREAVVVASKDLVKQLNDQQREVITLQEVAERLIVTKQSILNWSERDVDDNPLPVRYAGDKPRFWWSEVDEWTKSEAERRRCKKSKV